jgi:hypothetical protein
MYEEDMQQIGKVLAKVELGSLIIQLPKLLQDNILREQLTVFELCTKRSLYTQPCCTPDQCLSCEVDNALKH